MDNVALNALRSPKYSGQTFCVSKHPVGLGGVDGMPRLAALVSDLSCGRTSFRIMSECIMNHSIKNASETFEEIKSEWFPFFGLLWFVNSTLRNTLFWNLNYWDTASTLAGEVDEVKTTYPKALAVAMVAVVLSYFLPLSGDPVARCPLVIQIDSI